MSFGAMRALKRKALAGARNGERCTLFVDDINDEALRLVIGTSELAKAEGDSISNKVMRDAHSPNKKLPGTLIPVFNTGSFSLVEKQTTIILAPEKIAGLYPHA